MLSEMSEEAKNGNLLMTAMVIILSQGSLRKFCLR